MIQNEYDLNDEVQLKLVALLVREPETNLGLIEPSYFNNPVCLDIARVTKEAYTGKDLKSVRLEEDSLKALVWESLKEHHRSSARELKKTYMERVRKIFKISLRDKEVLLGLARKFAMDSRFREALIGAEKDLNAGQHDRILKRIQAAALPDERLEPSVKLPVFPLHRLIYGAETIDDVDNHLVYPIVPKGGGVLLYGLPKELKSWFAAALALDVACGRKALGFFHVPRPVKTLYVQVEDPQFVTQQRLKELARNQQSGRACGMLKVISRCPLNLYAGSRETLGTGCLYYYGIGQPNSALPYCAQMTAQFPNDRTAHSNYGWAALDAKQSQVALAEFSTAYKIASPDWNKLTGTQAIDLLWGCAISLYDSGDKKNAGETIRSIRKGYPSAATITGLQQLPLLWSKTTLIRIEALLNEFPQ